MLALDFSITNIKHYLHGYGYKTVCLLIFVDHLMTGLTFFTRIDPCRRKHRVDTGTSITYCGM